MKLTEFVGEDVDKALLHIQGAPQCLKVSPFNILDGIVDTLIKVFQTSPVPEFNLIFKTIKFSSQLYGN